MIKARTAVAFALSTALGAFAQNYPNKPIKLISPYPPGGGVVIVNSDHDNAPKPS